ncbi:MAG: arginine--tRNA ligase [Oscillospiraceae bacterium]|nr:arginine--tRNA ligase [Oscillospiraceae bacterium]
MLNLTQLAFEQCKTIIQNAYGQAVSDGVLPEGADLGGCEIPKEASHGDVSSNFALAAAKALKMPPRAIAQAITERLNLQGSYFCKVDIAGAGFINLFYGDAWREVVLTAIAQIGDDYGKSNAGQGKRVMVEFVSANPTGPMTLGNARGGVLGDALSSVLEAAGYNVWREFYVNDAGNQVSLLAQSIRARYIQRLKGEGAIIFPEKGYQGDDVWDLADAFIAEHGESYLDVDEKTALHDMVQFGLSRNTAALKHDLARYRIEYNEWFHESSLHKSGYVAETLNLLQQKGHLYEKDGATWFKSSQFGCDQDYVLVKSDGSYTYYAVDIAYHRDKLEKRGFDMVIDVLGADHHGHAVRFRAGLEALDIDGNRLQFSLYQLVNLLRDGESVRMSKRTGRAIRLADLLDEISVDAARFFFNNRSTDTHLEFDMGLAVREDSDNPVYYVQYAHARICSIMDKLMAENEQANPAPTIDAALLTHETELALLKILAYFPEEIAGAAETRQPYRVNRYLLDCAAAFHRFYNACRIKDAEPALRDARLALANATRQVLRNGLALLKVSAPEKM